MLVVTYYSFETSTILSKTSGDLSPKLRHSFKKLNPPQITPLPFELLTDFDLDEGESAWVSIAAGLSEPVLLIMDARAGRAVAKEKGIAVIGMEALIGEAKKRGLIPSAKEAFEVLHQSDFRISENVIRTVLQRVGE